MYSPYIDDKIPTHCDLCGKKAELVKLEKEEHDKGNFSFYIGWVCEACKTKEYRRTCLKYGEDPDSEPF